MACSIVQALSIKINLNLLEDITFEKTNRYCCPKTKGLQNIYDVFSPREPDSYCSRPVWRQLSEDWAFPLYAAANLFMDHFAIVQTTEKTKWISLRLSGNDFGGNNCSNRKQTSMSPSEVTALIE